MKTIAVIVAAGSGTRFGSDIPKQFLMLENKEILAYSLETFSHCKNVDEIVLVINKDFRDNYLKIIEKYNIDKISALVEGGDSRQKSVQNAIDFIAEKNDEAIVLVHDAARPYVSERIINENIEAVKNYKCCTTAVRSSDSVYLTKDGNFVNETNRDDVYLAQTPQSALLSIFKKGYENINEIYTDEAAIFAKLGYVPHIVLGEAKNSKITYPDDIKK